MQEISPRSHQHPTGMPDPEYVYIAESKELRLRDFWKAVVKRRRLVILVFLAALGLGAYMTSQGAPLYTATATLKIEPQIASAMRIEEGLAAQVAGTASNDYYQTQFALLQSRALAARAITKIGLVSSPTFISACASPPGPLDRLQSWLFGLLRSALTYLSNLFRPTPAHAEKLLSSREFKLGIHPSVVGCYLGLLQVSPIPNTRLVRVSFSTRDPHLSQELANAHADAFIRMHLETNFELTNEAREFLGRKLSEFKDKVKNSEEALHRFRQAHGVISLAGNENIVVERMVDLNRRLTEARTRRIELESLYQIVKNKNAQYLSQVIGNNVIQARKANLEALEAERARLATIFKPDYPRFLELSQQISEAEQRLNLEIANIVRGVESDYMDARARERALQAEAERQQQAALNLKELGAEYTILQGEVDANHSVYDSVLRRLNETNVSKDVPISNIQITDPAEIPLAPSPQKAQRTLLLASALGLLFGAGLACFLEYFNSIVRTPEAVWRAVSIPTLGVVPHLKSLRYSGEYRRLPRYLRRLTHRWAAAGHFFSQEPMVSQHPLSPISESYRTIRTVLLLIQAEKPPRVVLLTSPQPGDGKTSTTLNLAIALAQSGLTVVVVDADLRKGNCHTLLWLENSRGLSDILTGNLTLEEGVQRTPVDGLSLLSRGAVPSDPAALLGSGKMKEVLGVLRERFDFVLIDSPPVIAVIDATALSRLCDGVLLVLGGQRTTVEAARRAVERLEGADAPILGVVLNAIDFRDPDFADYRDYHKSYYAAAQREGGQRGRGEG